MTSFVHILSTKGQISGVSTYVSLDSVINYVMGVVMVEETVLLLH